MKRSFTNTIAQSKWDRRFMELALQIATWSKDPSTKVGCVIIEPKTRTILATGYNGFPRGVADTKERLEDRTFKLMTTVHAEANAIYSAARFGMKLDGAWLYTTFMPCNSDEHHGFPSCTSGIIQTGIRRVIVPTVSVPKRWEESMMMSKSLLIEAGLTITALGVKPEEAEKL